MEREDWDAMSADAREAWAQYPVYDDVTKVVALMATLPRAPKPEGSWDLRPLCRRRGQAGTDGCGRR